MEESTREKGGKKDGGEEEKKRREKAERVESSRQVISVTFHPLLLYFQVITEARQ